MMWSNWKPGYFVYAHQIKYYSMWDWVKHPIRSFWVWRRARLINNWLSNQYRYKGIGQSTREYLDWRYGIEQRNKHPEKDSTIYV